MASNVTMSGSITRVVNSEEVEIQFMINGDGTYHHQWGQSTQVLGQNVDLLEALVEAVWDAE
jgi:hypothetical protein